MKKIKVNLSRFMGKPESATIVISQKGLEVIDKNPKYLAAFGVIRNFISQCIDMDEWKHSWHLDISHARKTGSKERKRIRQILDEKIALRKDQIERLENAKIVLRRWHEM